MNDKIEAGRHVASRMFAAENAIDEAIVAAASLQISLVRARQETQQPCGTIQAALTEAAAASAALMEARNSIVRTHGKVLKLRDDLGLPTTGYGCTLPCLPEAKADETSQLKAV